VTLSGTVSEREAKRRAEDVAESILGVKEVQNNIRVKKETGDESKRSASAASTSSTSSSPERSSTSSSGTAGSAGSQTGGGKTR
jgi:hypothetical protein